MSSPFWYKFDGYINIKHLKMAITSDRVLLKRSVDAFLFTLSLANLSSTFIIED